MQLLMCFKNFEKIRLSADKLKTLGWQLRYPIDDGIKRVFKIMTDCDAVKYC